MNKTVSTTAIEIQFPLKRSRLTTLFRLVLAVPLLLFGFVYGIAAVVVLILTWFVMIIAGIYPAEFFKVTSGYTRFYVRFVAYLLLLVDAYPPFSGAEHPDYPVQVMIPERQEKYSRMLAAFRLYYVAPAAFAATFCLYVLYIIEFLLWIIIVIAGRLPRSVETYMRYTFGWVLKSQALYFLLVENY